MPYNTHEDNAPVSGKAPIQAQAKAASPDKLELVQPVNFAEAKRAFLQNSETVDAFLQAAQNSPEALPGIIDLAVDVASGTTRYISLMTSTCKVCGYVEEIEIPEDTEMEDILEAIKQATTACPECEASIETQTARADLEIYDQGLELLDDSKIGQRIVFLDGQVVKDATVNNIYPLNMGGSTGTVDRYDKGYSADVANAPEWGDVWYEQK